MALNKDATLQQGQNKGQTNILGTVHFLEEILNIAESIAEIQLIKGVVK